MRLEKPAVDPGSWLSPRIWRSPQADFNHGEALAAAATYTSAYLQEIRGHGFDAIWVRGRLRDMMHSNVLPQLNPADRQPLLESLRTTIARAAQQGIKLYVFFNDPLAIKANDPFWQSHEDIRGATHVDFGETMPSHSLCTSTATVKAFMAQGIDSIIRELPGLGGVILITASEHHSHCWSQYAKHSLDDGIVFRNEKPLSCPRCIHREPADVVAELTGWWQQALQRHQPDAKILAWNWSWSMWYPDPQREVIERLPQGVELLADFERGGYRPWRNEKLWVDEYALGYVGPSERFIASQDVASDRGMPTHAKLQIGTTHEMASVPNLPLIDNLHRKFVALDQRHVRGAMCTWAIGCGLTLNTYAMGLYAEDPERFQDAGAFFDALAQRYLGLRHADSLADAWRLFSQTWALFPFSIRIIYFGPVNIAPGVILEPVYRREPLKGTWHIRQDYGDAFETGCGPYTMQQVIEALHDMAALWQQGLDKMEAALTPDHVVDASPMAAMHRAEELSCARMIAIQIRSTYHLMAFHQWRLDRIEKRGLTTPGQDIALDDFARQIMADEIANLRPALALMRSDPRLGRHDEAQGHQYTEQMIEDKIQIMTSLLAR